MITKKQQRISRKIRIRAKIFGSKDRPRLSVFRSNKFLSVQLINDEKGMTIGAVRMSGTNSTKAKELGIQVAQLAKKKGIKTCVFDRSGYRYHGVIKTIADSVREGGIKI